jgi:predicted DNA-binding transcriptional regulator AlpA
MNADHSPHERLVTVNQAAELLGISVEAVRARMNRGTLPKEKASDGTVYVRMDADQMRPDDDDANDHTVSDSLAFQLMQDQIAFLRAELERKDHLLAAALERIPAALEEAPREARESPETASAPAEGVEVPLEERRPWWVRLFGG